MATGAWQNHRDRTEELESAAEPDRNRGQSEPLAALVAVSLVCLVVSAYVVLLTDVVRTAGTERSVSEPTADAVWQEISTDRMVDAGVAMRERIHPKTLPEGYNVAVTVSYIDGNGNEKRIERATFDESGEYTALSDPDRAERVTRAVTVRVGPGDKRPGQFTVEVWE
jgi:hypothetical protein